MRHGLWWIACIGCLTACNYKSRIVDGDPRDAGLDAATGSAMLRIEPASATFAEQWVGYPREGQSFTVTNDGDDTLLGLTASLAGEHDADFRVETSDCEALPPAATCTVAVSFTPSAGQERMATLRVGNANGGANAALLGSGKDPSDYNRVFVSSEALSTGLGSAEAYDIECNRLASTAGINNASVDGYIAWISSSTSDARDRLNGARGFVRMDGRGFADDIAAAEIFRAVAFDENGVQLAADTTVTTGTAPDGTASNSRCDDWSPAASFGVSVGDADGGPRRWSSSSFGNCAPRQVYCVEILHQRELIPPAASGRLIYLTNDDYDAGVTPDDACEASKPPSAGAVVALVATDSTRASDLLEPNEAYLRPDRIIVGLGSELSRGLWQSGVWQQGDGTYSVENLRVWTGSSTMDAVGDTTCNNWTTAERDVRGRFATPQTPAAGSFWGAGRDRLCSSSGVRFYCVETGD